MIKALFFTFTLSCEVRSSRALFSPAISKSLRKYSTRKHFFDFTHCFAMSNKSKKVYRRVRASQPRSQGFSPPRKALGTRLRVQELNGPFPSCCLSRFRNESWCSTIVREMSLICRRIRNSFPFEWLCTRTRFEAEACSNSEMGYYHEVENQSSLPSTFRIIQGQGYGCL